MTVAPTQMRIEYKDKSYSGIYSVSGKLVIARIPGIGSKSAEAEASFKECAKSLLETILQEAEALGSLS